MIASPRASRRPSQAGSPMAGPSQPELSQLRSSRRRFLRGVVLACVGVAAVPVVLGAVARWAGRGGRAASPAGWPGFAAMRRRRRSRRELAHLDLEAPHDLAG